MLDSIYLSVITQRTGWNSSTLVKAQTCHSLQSGSWAIMKRDRQLKSCQNYKTKHNLKTYLVKTDWMCHSMQQQQGWTDHQKPKHCHIMTMQNNIEGSINQSITQSKPWQSRIFDEVAVCGYLPRYKWCQCQTLYSHVQKRGRATEMSALSTSTTEIPLKTGSAQVF